MEFPLFSKEKAQKKFHLPQYRPSPLLKTTQLANAHIPTSKLIPAHTHAFLCIIHYLDPWAPINIQYLLTEGL